MFEIVATFGVSWKAAVTVAGIVFWANAGARSLSVFKAALLASGAGLGVGIVIMLAGLGVGYLVSKFYSESKLSMW